MDESLFEYEGMKLKAIESGDTPKDCKKCYFKENEIECLFLRVDKIIPSCHQSKRKDNKNVIFKEIEENKMEKRMFEDVMVGDYLYSPRFGKGVVNEVKEDSFDVVFREYYAVKKDAVRRFYKDGKYEDFDKEPTIFWEKPEIKYSTERPFSLEEEMRKLKVKEYNFKEGNRMLNYSHAFNKIVAPSEYKQQNLEVLYFTNESIDEFFEIIRDIEISFEEFEAAYKKVFLEGK